MIREIGVTLALLGTASAQPAPTLATPAILLLAKVEANYKTPQHLSATFEQALTNAVSRKVMPANGMLRIEKPNKLRFDFLQPKRKDPKPKATYLFDGKSLWVIDHQNLQVAQKATEGSELPSMVTFFLGTGTMSRDFKVAITADPALVPAGANALELTPKKPSAAYAKVILVLDARQMVTQTTIIDSSGGTQVMKFTSVELDKPAPAGTFVLDRKAIDGYKMIKP